ncbi:hypothetical protein YA0783_24920 [Pseudomonas corrugata]|uniref:hypothetical protein n=1 Tax=Pseudomonas corrugata TaxID=47879 RepID=UPI0018E61494|nr:hypothetical protein [Pseudomonas corrugata]MBI6621535.1 hypothetical protein [Pseudomonas corrugata]MBI6694230.1 hypothetical protein [Pseudomonas corrugata]
MAKKAYIRKTLVIIGVIAIAPVIMAVQFWGIIATYSDNRQDAIRKWEQNNPDGAATVLRYREACESGVSKADSAQSFKPTTFDECSATLGAPSLVAAIKAANAATDSAIYIPAPLRWVIQTPPKS